MQEKLAGFRDLIWTYYRRHRRSFPWRDTRDPYAILVSEVMLQQTQTLRVVPKYQEFLSRFPRFQDLAGAQLAEVLVVWKGLGYNRRAKALRNAARRVVEDFGGQLPAEPELLRGLPGLGPYTSKSVVTFAFNRPEVFIETNIRAVFLHVFFPDETGISDSALLPLVEQSLDHDNPREWYYALMDYGAYLKRALGNPSRRSASYNKQATFKGSVREARGRILAELAQREAESAQALADQTGLEAGRFRLALQGLEAEGLVAERDGRYSITD